MSVATPRQGRVREIDFRRPSKFNREQVRRLEVAHETFCQSAASRLSAELRTELQLSVLNTDQLPYSVVIAEEVPKQAHTTVLRIDQLGTEVVLIMEMSLAKALASRLLGGGGEPAPGNLTPVEMAVARRALESFVDNLSTTWIDLCETSFTIGPTATQPMAVQIVPPSEPTLLLNMSATMGSLVSIVTLVLPHRSVEEIMPRLEQTHYGPSTLDGVARHEIQSAMSGVDIELRAEVGAVQLPLAQVLAMKPGDTIRLKRPASGGVVLHVDDVPAYVANPGRNGNTRAVQVRDAWRVGR